MHQAIVTKYIGPTNHRGSRVVASCQAGSLTMTWDDGIGANENHTSAARALASLLGWSGAWVGGGLPADTGNAYANAAPAASHGIGRALTHAGLIADDLADGTFTIARTNGPAPIESGKRIKGWRPASRR